MFSLVWFDNDVQVDPQLSFEVGFPGRPTAVKRLSFRSSAVDTGTFENLTNVKLFMSGPDATVLSGWADLGGDENPELSGGVEVSFDAGRTFTRFSKTAGNASDPNSWILVPKSAIGSTAIDGKLTPFDTATILLRCVVPPNVLTRIYTVQIVPDFDIL